MEMAPAFPVHFEMGILDASSSSDGADTWETFKDTEQAIIILKMHHRLFVKRSERCLPE